MVCLFCNVIRFGEFADVHLLVFILPHLTRNLAESSEVDIRVDQLIMVSWFGVTVMFNVFSNTYIHHALIIFFNALDRRLMFV